MATRAALFDLGNTLVSYYKATAFTPILRRCLSGCLTTLGQDSVPPEMQEALLQQALALNREHEDLAVWPLADRLALLFGDDTPDAPTMDRLSEAFLAPIFATAQLMPGALQLLTALRERGVRTAIVSNTPWGSQARLWRTELARHGLLATVDATVFCMDVGWRKPHPAPFHRALELLNVAAADAVFVGDDHVWDVAGAERVGIRPILISPDMRTDAASNVVVVPALMDVLAVIDCIHPTQARGDFA